MDPNLHLTADEETAVRRLYRVYASDNPGKDDKHHFARYFHARGPLDELADSGLQKLEKMSDPEFSSYIQRWRV
jgi:hypothetical protein